MAHLRPLEYNEIEDKQVRETIEAYENIRGFVPNSIRTMARRPAIARAFMDLNKAILYDGTVPEATKMLVSLSVSLATGCKYCQSHMTNLSSIYKVEDEKIAALLNFQESALFSEAEKAAINIGIKSAAVPNEAEQADFDKLAEHYSEAQVVEIIATVSLFGYLNRWNDTMATQVEKVPADLTKRVFDDWDEGKHL